MEKNKVIKIGPAFSVPAKGASSLLWIIIYFFYMKDGYFIIYNPILYLFFIIGFYIIFSIKYLMIINPDKGIFKIKTGIGKFSYGKTRNLNQYSYAVVQKGTSVQKVQQGTAVGAAIIEGTYKEKFTGLFLYSDKYKTKTLFYKGDRSTIYYLIKEFISQSGIKTYNGAKKPGYEIKL